jgi:AcrR family transcriptional regulator
VTGVKGQVQQRGVERRRAILEAAIDVFARTGYRGSAVNEIGEQAGITGTGVLHHFGSKAALLLATIRERDRRAEPGFRSLAENGGIEMLQGLVRYARQADLEPGLNALHTVIMAESLGEDSPAHDYFLDRSRLVVAQLATGIERGKEKGEIRSNVDSAATATMVLAFQEGASLMAQLDPALSLADLYDTFLSGLIQHLSP